MSDHVHMMISIPPSMRFRRWRVSGSGSWLVLFHTRR